jgi:S-adenosylmethionine:tRNA-ribosyltransferase-isomerase (queuine synthetase)
MCQEKPIIYELDTRNQKDSYVTNYFDKHNIKWIRNKLYSGDIKLLNDTKVIIDLKANLEEIAHNLCNAKEHARIRREIDRAKEIGCEQFIFLIKEDKIKTIEDLQNWTSKRTKVKGETLFKIMTTMKQRYGVRFIIVPKKEMGKMIIKLLGGNND